MRIVFRVDASERIGSGHVMRCLTLADELKHKGAEIYFVCRELPGHFCSYIENKGFSVFRLSKPRFVLTDNCFREELHANWLGVKWDEDADEVRQIFKKFATIKNSIDWLIVDHYALDKRWEQQMRPFVKKIIVIDDLADRSHDCDLILDQNLYEYMENRYEGLVPEGCIKLLGPKYALLRAEFRKARKNLRKRDGSIKRILIFFGGSDPTNETVKALEAIQMLGRPDIVVDVVVGLSNLYKEQVKRMCDSMANVSYYCQVDNMAELMVQADLAIGAGGSATWERCCLGLPAITQSISFNQIAIAKMNSLCGTSIYLGQHKYVTKYAIADEIKKLLLNQNAITQLSINCQEFVDGWGVKRVANYLILKKCFINIVSDKNSWINSYLHRLSNEFKKKGHIVKLVNHLDKIEKGEFAFYLGFEEIVPLSILKKNRHNLVVHGSPLPQGKGWSPLTWQILEGKNEIYISLFEAAENVDSGRVYMQRIMKFKGTELVNELRKTQAETTIEMCIDFVEQYPYILERAVEQTGEESFYPRRTARDSELDIDKTIRKQFNLLRVVDNERYPAFFVLHGKKYVLKIFPGEEF